MAGIGPVVMSVAGDTFIESARILAVLWEGVTTAGDTAELRCPVTGRLLWAGRTNDTNTYLGVNVGVEGIHAPYGFRLTSISSGMLLVYPRES